MRIRPFLGGTSSRQFFDGASSREFFGGAPNAFAGGELFQQQRRRLNSEENALNALIERFGPEAADPAAFSQLQSIDQRDQLLPFELDRLSRERAAFDANVDQFGPVAGNATAEEIRTGRNQDLRGAAINAARGLQLTRERGGDLGQAFDRSLTVLNDLGFDTGELDATRELLISDPEFVDELVAMLSEPERVGSNRPLGAGFDEVGPDGLPRRVIVNADGTGSVLTDEDGRIFRPIIPLQRDRSLDQSQQRIGQGERSLDEAEARRRGFVATPGHQIVEDESGNVRAIVTPGTAEERAAQDRARRIRSEEAEAVAAAQEQVQIADVALNSLDNTLEVLDDFGAIQGNEDILGRGVRTVQGLPGVRAVTDVGRFQDEVQTLLANITIDRLAAIKSTGATLGQITAPELKLLQDSMGNLTSAGRSPELIRRDLLNIRKVLTDTRDRARQALSSDEGLEALLRIYGDAR